MKVPLHIAMGVKARIAKKRAAMNEKLSPLAEPMADPKYPEESDLEGYAQGGMPKLGSGKRFAHLARSLAHKPGIQDPKALAASIGQKKYGAKGMAHLAEGGEVFEDHDDFLSDEADDENQLANMKETYPDPDGVEGEMEPKAKRQALIRKRLFGGGA